MLKILASAPTWGIWQKETWCLDTTGREDREWNEAQRQGEVRVTFWITLMVMKVKIHSENYPGFGAISDTRTTLLRTHDFKTLIHFISLLHTTCGNCQSISTFDTLAFGVTFPTSQTDMQTLQRWNSLLSQQSTAIWPPSSSLPQVYKTWFATLKNGIAT